MYENAVATKKISLKKKFALAWIAVIVVLALAVGLAVVGYSGYKKAQDAAVAFVLISTSQFNSYKNDHDKMVEKMYDFFNPRYMNVNINGIKINNSDVVDAARSADKALGKLMQEAGYDCYYGSTYLEYIGIVDYTVNKARVPFIVWAVLFVVVLIANMVYSADAKKILILEGDRIVCKNGKKTVKEFFVKDVRSVESASNKGILLRGNAIRYKVNMVANADEVKATIMDAVAAASAVPVSVPAEPVPAAPEATPSGADELMKYKGLLDAGVISQEEFEAKKKQLLGL